MDNDDKKSKDNDFCINFYLFTQPIDLIFGDHLAEKQQRYYATMRLQYQYI